MSDDAGNQAQAEQGQREAFEAPDEYKVTCERCGLDRVLLVPPGTLGAAVNIMELQFIAQLADCPRAPRICGTIKVERKSI